ncbi:MAG: diadenosine tetraphosphate (Ap4A) HIT family hydrolase [Myxococcota bacterium]|jgi:diadenosine tetraphosphate (Ap4A) HIT family hydrolase
MTKEYDSNNIFAKIIRGEIPCEKVFEDEKVLAFNDISKAAPYHLLVIPKGEYSSFDDFSYNASGEEISNFFKKVRQVAIDQGLKESGYRLITNHGSDASQSVAHFHVHILGGKQLGGLIADDKLIR